MALGFGALDGRIGFAQHLSILRRIRPVVPTRGRGFRFIPNLEGVDTADCLPGVNNYSDWPRQRQNPQNCRYFAVARAAQKVVNSGSLLSRASNFRLLDRAHVGRHGYAHASQIDLCP